MTLCLCECQDVDPLESLRQTVPGEPGSDYPIYADPELDCQGYHVCIQDPENEEELYPVSFLCPNGTIFNQEIFTCEWWFNVDCSMATNYYSKNEGLFADAGASPGEGGSCPSVPP